MALVMRGPWRLAPRFHEEINRALQDWSGDVTSSTTADWVPAADIEEYPDRFELFFDLPGVPAKDVEITLESGILTLTGERVRLRSEDTVLHGRHERETGRFYRRFILPDTVDVDRVEARECNGVLGIRIPKQAKALPRKIEVAA